MFFTIIESAFVLGIANIAIAAGTLYYFRNLVVHRQELTALILLALVGLTSGLGQAQDWTLNAQQYLYRDPIVFSETTRYQHIVLTRSRGYFLFY